MLPPWIPGFLIALLAAAPNQAVDSDVALLTTGSWRSWHDADAARRRLADAGAEAVMPVLLAVEANPNTPRGPWLESALSLMAHRFRGKSNAPSHPGAVFRRALGDRRLSSSVRRLSGRMLGALADASAVSDLRAALSETELAPETARALGRIGAKEAAGDLIGCAESSKNPSLLRAAAWALGELNAADAVPTLAALAKGKDATTACAAIDALGTIIDPTALEALRGIPKPKSSRVRRRLALALLRHNVATVKERGIEALSSERGAACQGCHPQVFADFEASAHRRKLQMTCETCHGQSNEHMVEYGKVKPEKPMTKQTMPTFCRACHKDFKSHRDVVYDRLVGLDHRFARRVAQPPAKKGKRTDVAKARELVKKDVMPAGMTPLFRDDFEDGNADGWEAIPEENWAVEKSDAGSVLSLSKGARGGRPTPALALIRDHAVSSFRLTARAKCMATPGANGRDMCVLFGYTSGRSSYYVHFGAINRPGYNMIALIAPGQSRRLIDLEEKPQPRLVDREWHTLRVERDAETGVIKAYIDDMKKPLLTAVDKTLPAGLVGLGSLGDFGYFDDVELVGVPAKDVRIAEARRVMSKMGLTTRKKAPPPRPKSELPPAPAGMKLAFSDDFEDGDADGWRPKAGNVWRVAKDGGSRVYHLAEKGRQGRIRAPGAFSVIAGERVGRFTFVAQARCLTPARTRGRDMAVIFGYQDPEHFYYVHFSNTSDRVHNSIMIVNGKPRAPIKKERKPIARLNTDGYHLLKVDHDPQTGDIRAYIDDMDTPILTAADKTFTSGLVGVGSFDDTGYFDDVRLYVPGQ